MSERRVSSTALTNPFAAPHDDGFCELLLVRHGEQAYVEHMPLGDAIDPPLSELGRRQADAVAERLGNATIDAVYASPYERAHDTGRAIADRHGLEPTVVEELREIDLWGGLPQHLGLVDAVGGPDALRDIFRQVQVQRSWDAYPHGEGSESFRSRIRSAIDRIVEDHHGHRVVVACHGGVIGAVLAMVMHSPFDYGLAVHHTSITTVRAAGERRVIHRVNDYDHVLDFQTELNPLNLH